MEIHADRGKTLRFQLEMPEISEESLANLEGRFCLDFGDYGVTFPVIIDENNVAVIEIPKLENLYGGHKKAEASLFLHDDEYFFPVWKEEVKIGKARPQISAAPLEDKKESVRVAISGGKILQEETEREASGAKIDFSRIKPEPVGKKENSFKDFELPGYKARK
jgi:hypothetical protein